MAKSEWEKNVRAEGEQYLRTEGEYTPAPSLPSVEMTGEDMENVINLLDEGHDLKARIEEMIARVEVIKNELLQIQIAHDLAGFRNGNLAFVGSYVKGRRSLSKDALLENGVTPEQIKNSYREGEASWRRELKNLDKQPK